MTAAKKSSRCSEYKCESTVAFTLAVRSDVLPMVIYTEFTLNANIPMAAALSFGLGTVTWLALALARSLGGSSVAATG